MEKGARYRLAPVAPVAPVAPQARKSEPHISRHPFGRVPVLDIAIFYFTRRKPSCVTSIAPCRSPR
jgi:glutathione S-transferase